MKNVFMKVSIYQDTFGNHFAAMDESMITGKHVGYAMDASGQHSIIFESKMYLYFYLGSVSVNDAKHVLRLLIELDMIAACTTNKDLKTYVWGFNFLNPVKRLNKKLELWNS